MMRPGAVQPRLHPAPDVGVERIASIDGLLACEEAWREVEAADHDSTIFSTWEWTEAVALNLLPAGAGLWTLLVNQDQDTAGIVPLVRSQGPGPRTLTFLGAGPGRRSAAAYQDVIAADGSAATTIAGLCSYLDEHSAEWDMLWLQELPPDSQTIGLLGEAARERGWTLAQSRGSDVYWLDLPETWQEYRMRLGPVVRGALDIGLTGPRLHRVETRAELNAALQALGDWTGRTSKEPAPLRAFNRELADGLFRSGMLDVATLEFDGASAGVRAGFAHKGRHYLWSSAYRPGRDNGPIDRTAIVDGQALKAAIDAGFERADFLRDNPVLAQRYGATRRRNRELRIFHSRGTYWRYRLTRALRG